MRNLRFPTADGLTVEDLTKIPRNRVYRDGDGYIAISLDTTVYPPKYFLGAAPTQFRALQIAAMAKQRAQDERKARLLAEYRDNLLKFPSRHHV